MTARSAFFAIPRWVGMSGVAVIGFLAFASLFPLIGAAAGTLLLQGPAAVDPDLEAELAILFDPEIVVVIQKVLHVLGLIVFVGLATLLVSKKATTRLAPLAALALASLGVSLFAPLEELPGGASVTHIIGSLTPEALPRFWGSLSGVTLLVFLSVFPDGRWIPPWTRWLVGAAATLGLTSAVLPMSIFDTATWPAEIQAAWLVALPVVVVTGQLIRRQRSRLAQATRPVVISLVAALAAFVLLWAIQPELTPGALDLVVVTPRLRAVYALNILIVLSIAVFLFPVSVSFSIVRYRLFDVDLLINRAIVYGAVTALVGMLFFSLALVMTSIANGGLSNAVSGRVAGPIGVVLGVGVVLVFQPLRRRVQRVVDRRFYRERYDAEQVIDGFAAEMTRLVDPLQLETGLIEVIDKAVRPTFARLHTGPFPDPVTAAMVRGAVDRADLSDANLSTPFRAQTPGVLVPLLASGTLTGVLELGERHSATRYSKLDLNLLDRLARSAGPALQLARELELREKTAKEQERAANELDLAKRIQHGLLPSSSPSLDGWSFDAFYQPAREVGGDFYDWIQLPDGRLGIVIGDVSDKGIPAALVMATCRALLRSSAGTGVSPGELLADVNSRLQPDIPAGMFVTCLIVFLDPRDGCVAMANAGHNLPIVSLAGDAEEIMVRGMPLGLMLDMTYEEIATTIPASGTMILSSDGLAESHSPKGEMYGTKRLTDSLAMKPEGSLGAALGSHRDFVGPGWEQEDDMTMVTVHRASLLA